MRELCIWATARRMVNRWLLPRWIWGVCARYVAMRDWVLETGEAGSGRAAAAWCFWAMRARAHTHILAAANGNSGTKDARGSEGMGEA